MVVVIIQYLDQGGVLQMQNIRRVINCFCSRSLVVSTCELTNKRFFYQHIKKKNSFIENVSTEKRVTDNIHKQDNTDFIL